MSFAKIWPSGLVDGLSALDAAQLMQLDTDHSNAIDGSGGGAYAPTAEIDVGGSGLGRTLPATASPYAWDIFYNDTAADGTAHARTMNRARAFVNGAVYTGFTLAQAVLRQYLAGPGTGGGMATIPLNDILENGQVLDEVDVDVTIAVGHSALPTNLPQLNVIKHQVGATFATVLGTFSMAPGSVAAYENSGNMQLVAVTGLTEVVDKTQYRYSLVVADESGTNAIAGNAYYDVRAKGRIASFQPF